MSQNYRDLGVIPKIEGIIFSIKNFIKCDNEQFNDSNMECKHYFILVKYAC